MCTGFLTTSESGFINMRFWCADSLVSCGRNADSLKGKKCGFVWTWLGTVRFSAGLNKGENIYAVRYVVVEKVGLSVPSDQVSFSIYRRPNIHRISYRLSKSSLFFPGWLCHFKGLVIPVWREIHRSKILPVTSRQLTNRTVSDISRRSRQSMH